MYWDFVTRYNSVDFLIGETGACSDVAINAVNEGAFGGLEKRFFVDVMSMTPTQPITPAVLVEGMIEQSTLERIRAVRERGYNDVWILAATCQPPGKCDVYGFVRVLNGSPTVDSIQRRVSMFFIEHPQQIGALRFHG